MSSTASIRVMLCYDGSVSAGAAIEVAARLLPHARAHVAYVWTPPFASEPLRHRLWHGMSSVDGFVAAVEREGEAEAHRLAHAGAVVAGAFGWEAEPLVRRTYGGEGFQLGELAGEVDADLIVVGSRGLGGASAMLGSVSDVVVHYAPRPVLVVPHPLLQEERAVLDHGPIVLGWDGSAAAQSAHQTATLLFPDRAVAPVYVKDGARIPALMPAGIVELPLTDGHVERGRAVAAALAGQARIDHAALIVVGSHGRSALHEILLGSVAMATLHHAHRPVLVVPHRIAADRSDR